MKQSSSKRGSAKEAVAPTQPPPKPVNVVAGVPDAAQTPSRWRLGLVLLLFAGWAAFLIYCLLAARV